MDKVVPEKGVQSGIAGWFPPPHALSRRSLVGLGSSVVVVWLLVVP